MWSSLTRAVSAPEVLAVRVPALVEAAPRGVAAPHEAVVVRDEVVPHAVEAAAALGGVVPRAAVVAGPAEIAPHEPVVAAPRGEAAPHAAVEAVQGEVAPHVGVEGRPRVWPAPRGEDRHAGPEAAARHAPARRRRVRFERAAVLGGLVPDGAARDAWIVAAVESQPGAAAPVRRAGARRVPRTHQEVGVTPVQALSCSNLRDAMTAGTVALLAHAVPVCRAGVFRAEPTVVALQDHSVRRHPEDPPPACPVLGFRVRAYPALADPVQRSPILVRPVLVRPVLVLLVRACPSRTDLGRGPPHLASPVQVLPVRGSPVLVRPVLVRPVLVCPVLVCPVLVLLVRGCPARTNLGPGPPHLVSPVQVPRLPVCPNPGAHLGVHLGGVPLAEYRLAARRGGPTTAGGPPIRQTRPHPGHGRSGQEPPGAGRDRIQDSTDARPPV
jgi:hypothetical protein